MPIQEISSELDSLLQKGETVYWQATENRKSVTKLSAWAKEVLGNKVETTSTKKDWFKHIHASDKVNVLETIGNNDGNEVYSVEYRWAKTEGCYVWLREIGIRREPGSPDFEGLLYNISSQKESEKRTLNISEREKRKLGRELHDDLCQQMAGMLFFTNNLVYQIKTGKDPETLIEATTEIKKQLQISIEKTRCLSHGLNPVSLARKTFQECLVELIQQTQTLYSINCQFQMASNLTIQNQEIATHLFRITQESINNAVRHGGADTISITLQKEENFGILTIQDNGSGFESDPQNSDGMGLHNLRSRAGMINASIHIGNNKDKGVSVICKFDPNTIEL
ncbi:MAG: histidine kinase [Verrucomicrobia bacterium]|nr:histidine kinase [Verrucomicrobiota bacterium]MDA1065224.1 histidine kinase [Verrucomicrobiota bacterium]